jgi:hypothetical protein
MDSEMVLQFEVATSVMFGVATLVVVEVATSFFG